MCDCPFWLHAYCNRLAIQEGLKNAQLGQAQENILNKKEDSEGEMCEKKSDSGAKLHQLLDPSPRADAVAASWTSDFGH